MSLYVKNMNREFHNNKYLKAYQARTGDRGRKNMDDRSHYKSGDGDFLHDAHMNTRERLAKEKIGQGSTRDSKFKPGFYRRHVNQIDHSAERVREEERKLKRFEKHYGARLGNIAKNDNRHGNILAHNSRPSQAEYRPVRHAPEHSSGYLENENTKRQMRDPASRFHALITPEQRERHRVRRELITKGLSPASSDLGQGRRDFPSKGAADAFNHTQSSHNSRISRYGRAQVGGQARANNFHIGEQGVSPMRGRSPNLSADRLSNRSPQPDRYSPSPQPYASQQQYQQQNRFLG